MCSWIYVTMLTVLFKLYVSRNAYQYVSRAMLIVLLLHLTVMWRQVLLYAANARGEPTHLGQVGSPVKRSKDNTATIAVCWILGKDGNKKA